MLYIPRPILYGDFQQTSRQRDMLGELTEAFGATSKSVVPTVPMPREAVVPELRRVEGAMMKIAGKEQKDLGKIMSMPERVSLASRWTAGPEAELRAYTDARFRSLDEYKRAAGIHLLGMDSSSYLNDVEASIKDNVGQFTDATAWNNITGGVYPQLKAATASMYDNLESAGGGAISAIKDSAMPAIQEGVDALGSFAPVLGGLAGAGIGLLVGAIFKGLFSGDPEPQALHNWHDARYRFYRNSLGGSGCLVTVECDKCKCRKGDVQKSCGFPVPGGCVDCEIPVASSIDTPPDLGLAKPASWVAWWHGGYGPHQGDRQFPITPPWWPEACSAMLKATGIKDYQTIVNKLRDLRYSAEWHTWQEVLPKSVQARMILKAAGMSQVNIDTLMWLYWFEPLPEGFGQVVPMSKFSSTQVGDGSVHVTSMHLPPPSVNPQQLFDKVHGGLLASPWTIAALAAGAGGLGLMFAATRRG